MKNDVFASFPPVVHISKQEQFKFEMVGRICLSLLSQNRLYHNHNVQTHLFRFETCFVSVLTKELFVFYYKGLGFVKNVTYLKVFKRVSSCRFLCQFLSFYHFRLCESLSGRHVDICI